MEKLEAYARASFPILVDPKTSTFAVSVHRSGNSSDPATSGCIYLAGASPTRPQMAIDLEQTLLLFDRERGAVVLRTVDPLAANSSVGRGQDGGKKQHPQRRLAGLLS